MLKWNLIKEFYNVYSNNCTNIKVHIRIASLLKVVAFFPPIFREKNTLTNIQPNMLAACYMIVVHKCCAIPGINMGKINLLHGMWVILNK